MIRIAMGYSTRINDRLKEVLVDISSQMSKEEIEKRSRVQKRGCVSLKKFYFDHNCNNGCMREENPYEQESFFYIRHLG